MITLRIRDVDGRDRGTLSVAADGTLAVRPRSGRDEPALRRLAGMRQDGQSAPAFLHHLARTMPGRASLERDEWSAQPHHHPALTLSWDGEPEATLRLQGGELEIEPRPGADGRDVRESLERLRRPHWSDADLYHALPELLTGRLRVEPVRSSSPDEEGAGPGQLPDESAPRGDPLEWAKEGAPLRHKIEDLGGTGGNRGAWKPPHQEFVQGPLLKVRRPDATHPHAGHALPADDLARDAVASGRHHARFVYHPGRETGSLLVADPFGRVTAHDHPAPHVGPREENPFDWHLSTMPGVAEGRKDSPPDPARWADYRNRHLDAVRRGDVLLEHAVHPDVAGLYRHALRGDQESYNLLRSRLAAMNHPGVAEMPTDFVPKPHHLQRFMEEDPWGEPPAERLWQRPGSPDRFNFGHAPAGVLPHAPSPQPHPSVPRLQDSAGTAGTTHPHEAARNAVASLLDFHRRADHGSLRAGIDALEESGYSHPDAHGWSAVRRYADPDGHAGMKPPERIHAQGVARSLLGDAVRHAEALHGKPGLAHALHEAHEHLARASSWTEQDPYRHQDALMGLVREHDLVPEYRPLLERLWGPDADPDDVYTQYGITGLDLGQALRSDYPRAAARFLGVPERLARRFGAERYAPRIEDPDKPGDVVEREMSEEERREADRLMDELIDASVERTRRRLADKGVLPRQGQDPLEWTAG